MIISGGEKKSIQTETRACVIGGGGGGGRGYWKKLLRLLVRSFPSFPRGFLIARDCRSISTAPKWLLKAARRRDRAAIRASDNSAHSAHAPPPAINHARKFPWVEGRRFK